MEYDIKLQHKAGRQMIIADALSRRADYDHSKEGKDEEKPVTALPEELWIRLLDMELQDAVAKAQVNDELALEVLRKFSTPLNPPEKWTIETDPNGSKILFYDQRMYVPDDLLLRKKIVSDHHDTSVGGHMGTLTTVRSIRSSYFWPGLQHFVRNYIAGCAICQQFKVSTKPTRLLLYPIPSGSHRLFGSIGMDFMTDLLTSMDGYDSIMVTVDHGLSKGAIFIPCNKKGLTSEHTAQLFIDNVYSRFGLPDKIITDRGTQFEATFFQEICKLLGIKSAMTTAFHPQANGGTERVNREIQVYLSIFCINNPSSWSNAFKKAEFVYNNRTHADRTQTPFELMYGEAPKAIPEAFSYSEYPSLKLGSINFENGDKKPLSRTNTLKKG